MDIGRGGLVVKEGSRRIQRVAESLRQGRSCCANSPEIILKRHNKNSEKLFGLWGESKFLIWRIRKGLAKK